jgi:hypothetical protein
VVTFIKKFFRKKQESKAGKSWLSTRRGQYSLHAMCVCGHQFSEGEILKSFSPKYYLYITCSVCRAEVTPYLQVNDTTKVVFRSPVVVLCYIKHLITGRVPIDISDLSVERPDLFHSAIFHFGSVTEASELVKKSLLLNTRTRLVSLLRVLPARLVAHIMATSER